MKIAHISDIHWRGIARHEEYTKAFKMLYDKLRKIKPDIIINTGDTFHTKTQGITPEIIERLSWMFRSLANIAPTYTLLGNHDGNLTNLNRKDVITPIHEAINHPSAHLLRDSKAYPVYDDDRFIITAYSPFDMEPWDSLKPVPGKINIALYHGTTSGCKFDNGFILEEGEAEVVDFIGYDFVLLGDIHKQQNIAYRLDEKGKAKPWISYPGSLLQQNFGEDETKGFLVWDIKDQKNWDVEFVEIDNEAPFVTVGWAGTVFDTLENIKATRGDRAFVPGSRFRVTSSQSVPQIQKREFLKICKGEHKASEVVFNHELESKMESISTESVQVSKKGLRYDPDAVYNLYIEYLKAHSDTYDFTSPQLKEAHGYVCDYLTKLNQSTPEATTTNSWSLKWLEFDNLFRYGENNRIDFNNIEGIVGIFGPNRSGKSSIIGAIMYALFNTTDRGPIKNANLINQQKKYCSANIRFSVGVTDYIVERKSIRTIKKDGTDTGKVLNKVDLFEIVLEDGAEKKLVRNSISTTDTDKEIRRLIGSSEDFLLTAFAAQGDLNRFISEGATNRKKHLARFLEIDIFDKLYTYAKADVSEANLVNKLFSEEEWNKKINSAKKNIESCEGKIKDAKEQHEELSKQKDVLHVWVEQNKQTVDDLDKIGTLQASIEELKSKGVNKTSEIKEVTDEIISTKKTVADLMADVKKYNREKLAKELEEFTTQKEKFTNLSHSLEKANDELSRQEKSITKLNTVPCGDSFSSCRFISDSHDDKKKIAKQRVQVDLITREHANNAEVLEILSSKDIQRQITLHDDAFVSSKIKESFLNKTEEKLLRLESEQVSLKEKLIASEKDLESLQEKATKIESKEWKEKTKEYDNIKIQISDIDIEKATNLQQLGRETHSLENFLQEKLKSQDLITRLAIYKSIQIAFSKVGIPAMILLTQLPAINIELEKILESIVEFNIELETDVSSNVMDVYIVDNHSRRIIELCSGMEKTLCSLALRVALMNLSSLPRPDIFVIDEGFVALDEESQQACMDMLSLLRAYFKTVLVISHANSIKEFADELIEVKFTGDESKVYA